MKNHLAAIVIICFLIGFLLGLLILNTSEAETVTMYGVCEKGSINVRLKPNGHSEVCGKLEFGWPVDILDSRQSGKVTWYKVDGITEYGYGWVNGNYLLSSEPTKPEEMHGTVTANGRVAVYSITGKRKGWVKPNESLRVIIYSEERCFTNKGWVKTQYLDIYEKENE